LNLSFIQFWFEFLKDQKLVEFFDTLLLNLRKYKDTYKLQLVAEMRSEFAVKEREGVD
jgi:hypothetical protein